MLAAMKYYVASLILYRHGEFHSAYIVDGEFENMQKFISHIKKEFNESYAQFNMYSIAITYITHEEI